MPRKAKAYVLDSWAVLAYLEDEPAGEKVANLLVEAQENGQPVCMSAVNAGEVWYIVAREISEADADTAIKKLLQLGIELVEVGWLQSRTAATFKARGKISYADCFAAALALERKGELVTGDPEFKQVEDRVKVLWI